MPDPSEMTVLLEAVVSETDLEGCDFNMSLSYYYTMPSLTSPDGQYRFQFKLPDVSWGVDELSKGLGVLTPNPWIYGQDDFGNFLCAARVAMTIARKFNGDIKGKIEEAERKLEEAEREAEERREVRKQALAERKQRLLTEFLDEKGRIRVRRSKSYQPVVVETRQIGDEEWEPEFRFINAHDIGREKRIEHSVVFDVKVGSRYRCVWDDGVEDLHEYDRDKVRKGRTKVAEYNGELEEEGS